MRGYCGVNNDDTSFRGDHAHVAGCGYSGVVIIACNDHGPDATSADRKKTRHKAGLEEELSV